MITKSAIMGLLFVMCITSISFAGQDGGYDITSELWAKAVLEVPGNPVTLRWKMVGADITPSSDQVISGYFYANPNDFAYGSEYNPELFVKIYIAANGWCNIAFNHVTVDDVTVYSGHNNVGLANQTGTVTLNDRLDEHQYTSVSIDNSLFTRALNGKSSYLSDMSVNNDGFILTSNLWAKAVLQVPGNPVPLVWKIVGSDTTPSGDCVVSGYFYADPDNFAYGSEYNPEVFVKIYVTSNGWANIAYNHVTVDNVDVYSANEYNGNFEQYGNTCLEDRLIEHQYTGVKITDCPDTSENDDSDGDGYTEIEGDCDDSDSNIHPGATEICGDGIDQDCDGVDLTCPVDPNDTDNDQDGYTENEGDCDDTDSDVYPGAKEICGDGIDQDCDGKDEACDDDIDDDNDGYTENEGDCNDNDANINPDAVEICGDGIDQDCDGVDQVCTDGDWTGKTSEDDLIDFGCIPVSWQNNCSLKICLDSCPNSRYVRVHEQHADHSRT